MTDRVRELWNCDRCDHATYFGACPHCGYPKPAGPASSNRVPCADCGAEGFRLTAGLCDGCYTRAQDPDGIAQREANAIPNRPTPERIAEVEATLDEKVRERLIDAERDLAEGRTIDGRDVTRNREAGLLSHWNPADGPAIPKTTLIEHALYGLGFEVRQMRDTPLDKLDVAAALKRIEDECVRIAKGEVSDMDIIG